MSNIIQVNKRLDFEGINSFANCQGTISEAAKAENVLMKIESFVLYSLIFDEAIDAVKISNKIHNLLDALKSL